MAKFTDAVVVTLKSYFDAGDQPTEAQFDALIDAIQQGIEEHDHSGTGDGDGINNLVGPVGIGIAPGAMLHTFGPTGMVINQEDAGVDDVVRALTLTRTSTGVVADDFGTEIRVNLDNEAGVAVQAANIYVVWSDVTEDESYMSFWLRDAGMAEKMRLNHLGRLGLGNDDPLRKLDVKDDVASYIARFWNDGGADDRWGIQIWAGVDANPAARLVSFHDGDGGVNGYVIGDGAGGVTYFSSSDVTLKNVLGPIDQNRVMKALTEVNPIQYVGKGLTTETGRKNFGFSAQEMSDHFPEVATKEGISYERLVPILWAQNQALLKRIEAGGL